MWAALSLDSPLSEPRTHAMLGYSCCRQVLADTSTRCSTVGYHVVAVAIKAAYERSAQRVVGKQFRQTLEDLDEPCR